MQETDQIHELKEPLEQHLPHIWQDLVYHNDATLTLCVPANLSGQKQPHYPVILFAPDSYTNRLSALLQFTHKGYAVAILNVLEKDPLKNFNSAARFLMLHAWQYQLDPHRIIAMGEGFGAYAAAGAILGVGKQTINREDIHTLPVHFRSCITISGKFTLAGQPQLTDLLGKRQLPPFLLFHGESDKLVSFQESRAFFELLNDQAADVAFYKIKDCPHGSDAFFTPYVLDLYANFIAKTIQKGK